MTAFALQQLKIQNANADAIPKLSVILAELQILIILESYIRSHITKRRSSIRQLVNERME